MEPDHSEREITEVPVQIPVAGIWRGKIAALALGTRTVLQRVGREENVYVILSD
jgi:hypothetical protein